jgi:2-keto-4-pentenoate hydratase
MQGKEIAPIVHSGQSAAHEETALRLRNAYREGAIAPLRSTLAVDDVEGAYAVQKVNTTFWTAAGRRVIGRKIGLTATSVQRQLGVDQPDFGVLFDDMSVADGGEIVKRLLQPRIEGEVAFVMARDFDNPRATTTDLMAAIAYALPAIEVVDSRIIGWQISIADTVADNASASHFVLGTEPRLLAGLDLVTCGMVLTVDGSVVSVGAGAACLGHPLNSVVWLARMLSSRNEPLRAGDVIMSGALGPMVPMVPNTRMRVKIGGLGSAEFSFRGTST